METIQKNSITLKRIFQENWDFFLASHQSLVTWTMAYNVWKTVSDKKPVPVAVLDPA